MSAVKVGDRVRATCGESVLVGTVAVVAREATYVIVDGDEDCGSKFLHFDVWAVEVVLPPLVPDIAGTIVRDREGDAWQRYDDLWCCVGSYSYPLAKVQERYGPLTVLWTPGDAT